MTERLPFLLLAILLVTKGLTNGFLEVDEISETLTLGSFAISAFPGFAVGLIRKRAVRDRPAPLSAVAVVLVPTVSAVLSFLSLLYVWSAFDLSLLALAVLCLLSVAGAAAAYWFLWGLRKVELVQANPGY